MIWHGMEVYILHPFPSRNENIDRWIPVAANKDGGRLTEENSFEFREIYIYISICVRRCINISKLYCRWRKQENVKIGTSAGGVEKKKKSVSWKALVVAFRKRPKSRKLVWDAYEKKGFRVNSQKRIYFLRRRSRVERERIVFVVVLFRRFLINDGYFWKGIKWNKKRRRRCEEWVRGHLAVDSSLAQQSCTKHVLSRNTNRISRMLSVSALKGFWEKKTKGKDVKVDLRKKIECAYVLSWPLWICVSCWGEREAKTKLRNSLVWDARWSENHNSEKVFFGHLHTVTAWRRIYM